MAIKAGLVGVNPKGVDHNGMPIGSGSSGVSESQLTANGKKFFFAYDETTQKYGYKLDGAGDFIPFESAGGGPGWVKPANLIDDNLQYGRGEIVDGGYYIEDDTIYIDITLKRTYTGSGWLQGFPLVDSTTTVLKVSGSSSDVSDVYTPAGGVTMQNYQTQYAYIETGSTGAVGDYYHVFGMAILSTP